MAQITASKLSRLLFQVLFCCGLSCYAQSANDHFEYKISVSRTILPTSNSPHDKEVLASLIKSQESLPADQRYRPEVIGPISRLKLATEGKLVPIDILVKFDRSGNLYVQYIYRDSAPAFTLEYYASKNGFIYEVRPATREVKLTEFSDTVFSDFLVLIPELNNELTNALINAGEFTKVNLTSLWNKKGEYLTKVFMNGFEAERWSNPTDGVNVLIKSAQGTLIFKASLLGDALGGGSKWDVRRYANKHKELMMEVWNISPRRLIDQRFSFDYEIPSGKGYLLEDKTGSTGKVYNVDREGGGN